MNNHGEITESLTEIQQKQADSTNLMIFMDSIP